MPEDNEAVVVARGAPVVRVLPAGGDSAGGRALLRHRGLLRCARRHPRGLQGGDRPGVPAAGPPVPPGQVPARRARLGGRDQRVRREEVPAYRNRL